jgi:hypothetical protein
MSRGEWILLLTLVISFYNTGIIWMVQVSYRLWAFVGTAEFEPYHAAWWSGLQGIQPVVFPAAGLATLGALALLWWRPESIPGWMAWSGVAIQAAIWILTALLWAPWQGQLHTAHVRLADGSLNPLYIRLLTTHWLRVGLITAYGLLMLWMMVVHLTKRIP